MLSTDNIATKLGDEGGFDVIGTVVDHELEQLQNNPNKEEKANASFRLLYSVSCLSNLARVRKYWAKIVSVN